MLNFASARGNRVQGGFKSNALSLEGLIGKRLRPSSLGSAQGLKMPCPAHSLTHRPSQVEQGDAVGLAALVKCQSAEIAPNE
jgi:hypothetical protein